FRLCYVRAVQFGSWRFKATCGHVKHSAKAPARCLCAPGLFCHRMTTCVLLFDGAMGTNIQRHALTAADFGGAAYEGCNDYLVLTRPDVVRGIHESFLAVGCDVVETCTFQSTPRRLREWGLGDKVHELNVRAAQLAREACDSAGNGRQRFVAGSIGPTGMLPSSDDPTLSAVTFGELVEDYYQQAKALVEGGVDLL